MRLAAAALDEALQDLGTAGRQRRDVIQNDDAALLDDGTAETGDRDGLHLELRRVTDAECRREVEAGVALGAILQGVTALGIALGAVLLLPMFAVAPPAPGPGELQLDFVDVGQGMAVLARTRHHVLLYDTGPAWGDQSDSGERVLLPLLPAWREQPGMLGVRLIFNSAATAPLLSNGTIDWFWPAAEKAGVPVMCHAPELSQHLARIAERHPQLVLILDNMGLSQSLQSATGGHTDDLIRHTLSLAKYPNVSVKLSSAANHSHEDYPYRDINVHIRRVFDAYGPQRCHWGSDMTRALDKATYRQRVTHFTEALDFLSEADKDQVMGRSLLARLRWA